MLDMSWGEVMLIGGVALIVIGPKELPKALRTVGQVTSKLRRMAGEFHAQFNEAMREAELDDVRRDVEGINRSVAGAMSPGFNPIQTIRDELKGAVDGAAKPSATALASATAQLEAERREDHSLENPAQEKPALENPVPVPDQVPVAEPALPMDVPELAPPEPATPLPPQVVAPTAAPEPVPHPDPTPHPDPALRPAAVP